MKAKYLYRGLHDDEIAAKTLLPKKVGSFAEEALTPIKTPFTTGVNRDNAIRSHQKQKYGHPHTSGVSTTKSFGAAIGYATEKGTKDGVVAVINRDLFEKFNIKEEDTAQAHECLIPEDEEVILFDDVGAPMPKEIIEKFISVEKSCWAEKSGGRG